MVRALKSELWDKVLAFRRTSLSLGVRNGANYLAAQKAVTQFGENNVEVSVQFNVNPELLFGYRLGLFTNLGDIYECVTIVIHWADVTITNEESKSTRIKDLFCKVIFNNGEFYWMSFARTTFTQQEWDAQYSHSHLYRINYRDPLAWTKMCLGTGPINDTINALSCGQYQEETLDVFFWELDKLVHVESLKGTPYIRMSSIGTNSGNRADINFDRVVITEELKKFMQSFFAAVQIPLGFENGNYVCGCTFMDFALMVTNYWNKYKELFPYVEVPGLRKCDYVLKNGAIYTPDRSRHDYSWRNLHVSPIIFKERTYELTVINNEDQNTNVKSLVYLSTVKYIQRVYLALVNMKFNKNNYGKEKDNQTKEYDKGIHTLYSSRGVCSTNSPYGASIEDSILVL